MAFVGASPLATGSATSITPVYSTATAGNVLICCVTSQMTTPASFTLTGSTTGWTQRQHVGATNVECEIWDKIAVGSDTMPTWNAAGGNSEWGCIVAEFSVTVTYDQGGTQTGSTSPATVTASVADTTSSDLIVAVRMLRGGSAGLNSTSTDNVNSLGVGTGINVLGDDGGTSQTGHHHSLYVTTATTGGSADNDVATWTFTSTHAALCIGSWQAAAVTAYPLVPFVKLQAVKRAGFF